MLTKLVFTLVFLPALAKADPVVIFTNSCPQAFHLGSDEEALFQEAALRCETIERIGVGLTATSLVFNGSALALACFGMAPASVILEGGALGAEAIGLIVGQLPCDNSTRDSQIQALAEKAVCEELESHGIGCKMH